eukprot:SAG11_NODE_781_length_7193_cov_25.713561_1_plen_264_part_00
MFRRPHRRSGARSPRRRLPSRQAPLQGSAPGLPWPEHRQDTDALSPGTDRTRAISAAAHAALPRIDESSRRGGLTVNDLQHLLLREGWRPPRATERTPDGRLRRPGGTKAKLAADLHRVRELRRQYLELVEMDRARTPAERRRAHPLPDVSDSGTDSDDDAAWCGLFTTTPLHRADSGCSNGSAGFGTPRATTSAVNAASPLDASLCTTLTPRQAGTPSPAPGASGRDDGPARMPNSTTGPSSDATSDEPIPEHDTTGSGKPR